MGAEDKLQTVPGLLMTDHDRFSHILRSLPDQAPGADRLRLGGALDHLGTRAHGTVILLLALPEALPLPVPSIGAVLGVPLILISAHLAVFGERGPVPRRLLAWPLPDGFASFASERLAPFIARIERVSRTRLTFVAGWERPVGLICLLLSILLILPVPLLNVPPAIGLAILSWGLVQRDGLAVAVGLGYSAALFLSLGIGAVMLRDWLA